MRFTIEPKWLGGYLDFNKTTMNRKISAVFLVLSLLLCIFLLVIPLFLFGGKIVKSLLNFYWESNPSNNDEIISPEGEVYELVEEVMLTSNALEEENFHALPIPSE